MPRRDQAKAIYRKPVRVRRAWPQLAACDERVALALARLEAAPVPPDRRRPVTVIERRTGAGTERRVYPVSPIRRPVMEV